MRKYDIVLVNLNPTKGSEQKGIRPCLVLQNNLANASKIATVAIAPITSTIKNFPSSIIVKSNSKNKLQKDSRIELSQIRTIDKTRIIKKIGILDNSYKKELCEKLVLFFDLTDEF